MDRLINITNRQASTSQEDALKIDETKLVNFIPKILVWNHFNVWRENYIASSRDEKSNMIQKFYSDMVKQGKSIFIFIFYKVKNAD